jgi:alcohol dehydrogenase (NADP+)
VTQGGYSDTIVCDADFVLHVSDRLPLEGVAPLLCAGITTYSPLRRWGVGPGHRVAVLGLGGLGHMAVKFAGAFGADVTVLSTSASKEASAKELGAHHFCHTKDPERLAELIGTFDFILDTVSAPHDYDASLRPLRRGGVLVCVGLPTDPVSVSAFSLVSGNKILTGSGIGGIAETQEMLDYCAERGIVSDVEVISAERINEAYERILRNDVKYRFVTYMATL